MPASFSIDANKIIEILKKKVEDLLWENTMLAAALESSQEREQALITEIEQLRAGDVTLTESTPPGGRPQMPQNRSGSSNGKGPHKEGSIPSGTRE